MREEPGGGAPPHKAPERQQDEEGGGHVDGDQGGGSEGADLREYVEVSECGWLNIHSKREWLSPKITSGRRPRVIFGDNHSSFE